MCVCVRALCVCVCVCALGESGNVHQVCTHLGLIYNMYSVAVLRKWCQVSAPLSFFFLFFKKKGKKEIKASIKGTALNGDNSGDNISAVFVGMAPGSYYRNSGSRGHCGAPPAKTGLWDGDLGCQRIMNVAPCFTQTAGRGSFNLSPRLKSVSHCVFAFLFFSSFF